MNPTSSKHAMKLAKPMARLLLEHPSAWSAHQDHKCLHHCWYCYMERKLHAQG
jgi:DNA repair photolyase